jgi:zinc transporter
MELRVRAQRSEAPAAPGAFLAAVAHGLAMRMGPSAHNLEEMLDDIDEAMLDAADVDPSRRSALSTIRRQAISLRRFLVPQREALRELAASPSPLLTPHDVAEIRLATDQVTRVSEALEDIRDRAAVTQDELRARHEARVGRTLYLLTIVATVALPLGLMTGLLGINVGGIPLADSPLGFAIVSVALISIAVLEVVLLRVLRWI